MLTGNYEYFQSILQNLHLPIETYLSEKPSMFSCIVLPFLESKLNLRPSEKSNSPHRLSISEVIESERCAYLNA